jgi:hypothetical protein
VFKVPSMASRLSIEQIDHDVSANGRLVPTNRAQQVSSRRPETFSQAIERVFLLL